MLAGVVGLLGVIGVGVVESKTLTYLTICFNLIKAEEVDVIIFVYFLHPCVSLDSVVIASADASVTYVGVSLLFC